MNTQQVADRLVELIRAGKYMEAHDELYSQEIVSIENPVNPDERMKYSEVKGMEPTLAKTKAFADSIEEMHGGNVSDPLVTKSAFAITLSNDITFKGMGRMQIEELGIYTVKDGKIVREEFIF